MNLLPFLFFQVFLYLLLTIYSITWTSRILYVPMLRVLSRGVVRVVVESMDSGYQLSGPGSATVLAA